MRAALALLFLASCVHKQTHVVMPKPAPVRTPLPARLAAVLWPTRTRFIECTRRLDDAAQPIGVAGPCYQLEAGELEPYRVVSWVTLGRFEDSAPDYVPASFGGRCRLEIVQGDRHPLHEATLTWVTPTQRVKLDDWMPTDDAAAVEADQFTIETSFAPEGEWMAIMHVAVGLGDGERLIQVSSFKLLKVPACE